MVDDQRLRVVFFAGAVLAAFVAVAFFAAALVVAGRDAVVRAVPDRAGLVPPADFFAVFLVPACLDAACLDAGCLAADCLVADCLVAVFWVAVFFAEGARELVADPDVLRAAVFLAGADFDAAVREPPDFLAVDFLAADLEAVEVPADREDADLVVVDPVALRAGDLVAADLVVFFAAGLTAAFFAPRVAPPRPRSSTPDSVRTPWTKPNDRPAPSAILRMLSPAAYFLAYWDASVSRCAPVIREPLAIALATLPPGFSSHQAAGSMTRHKS